MKTRDGKQQSLLALIVGIGLFATGAVALPVGIVLMIVGQVLYGLLAIGYSVVAVAIAVFGSDRLVVQQLGWIFPWPWR